MRISKTPDGKSIDAASALAPLGDSLTRPLRDLRISVIERLVRAFVCLGVARVGPDRPPVSGSTKRRVKGRSRVCGQREAPRLLDPIETFEHFVTINRQGPGR
jgi:hypothetical protein